MIEVEAEELKLFRCFILDAEFCQESAWVQVRDNTDLLFPFLFLF